MCRRPAQDWVGHPGVAARYAAIGVTSLYPWQAAALECGEDGANLVYCAPTSGGKSIVAEVLMVRQLLAHASTARLQRKGQVPAVPRALLILPFIRCVLQRRMVEGQP